MLILTDPCEQCQYLFVPTRRATYHHGHLRRALIETATAMLADGVFGAPAARVRPVIDEPQQMERRSGS